MDIIQEECLYDLDNESPVSEKKVRWVYSAQ